MVFRLPMGTDMHISRSADSPVRVPSSLIRGALIAVGASAIGGVLFLAAFHLHDRAEVLHVQGTWMGLAQYVNEGVLYPPLFDGEHYGGTRWMPLPILENAAASRITGEYLASGKLVGLVMTALLLLLVFGCLRRLSTPLTMSAALTGTIVATDPGRVAATTVGGDVLPVVLQVGALMVATSATRTRAMMAAGILAGLALASKMTALWAALALITWFVLHRRWRNLAVFCGAFAGTTILVLGVVEVLSRGRFSQNLIVLTFAGVGGGLMRAPYHLVLNLAKSASPVLILVPFALFGALNLHSVRRISVYHLALGWASLLLLATYTDVGADFNHLLDVTVLTVLAVGHLASRLNFSPTAAPLATVLALVVIWGAGTGFIVAQVPGIRMTIQGAPAGYPVKPLADLVGPADEILSEDPYIPLSLGRNPVVLDPFMLRRLDQVDPAAVDKLIDRIENREFDYLAMFTPIEEEGNPDANDYVWEQFHFGLRVVGAMRRAYVSEGVVDGYYLYGPAS